MKNKVKVTILLIILMLSIGILLSACSSYGDVDLTDYVKVTYDCMGGRIGTLPTKVIHSKIGAPALEPHGTSNLTEAIRAGYTLDGWFTKYTADFSENPNGEYVYIEDGVYKLNPNGEYVYIEVEVKDENGDPLVEIGTDEEGNPIEIPVTELAYVEYDEDLHENLARYTLTSDYVLYEEDNPLHAGKTRYKGFFYFDEADRWNFKTMPVTEEMTLYAKWIKELDIIYVYEPSESGNEKSWTYTQQERGETLSIALNNVTKTGYTFVKWYRDRELTEPWDMRNDVYPTEEYITEIRLYARYIEGSYIRIESKDDLPKVKQNLGGKYILINDIDLEGAVGNPFGISAATAFTGIFDGDGNTISGFVIDATNNQGGAFDRERNFGLFNTIEGAVIKNLNLECSFVINENSNKTVVIGAVAGIATGENKIENCNVTVSITSNGRCSSNIEYGPFIGRLDEKDGNGSLLTTIITGSAADIQTDIDTSGTVTPNASGV